MKSNRDFRFRRFVGLSLMIVAMLLCSISSAAQDMPDPSKTGTIGVEMKDSKGEAIPGGKFRLYQVAELVLNDDNLYVYQYSAGFTSLTEKLTIEGPIGKGGDDVKKFADSIATFINNSAEGIPEPKVLEIDASGKATVDGLKLGVYLFIQSEVSDPSKYQPCDPFLVTVPYFDNDGKISYEVNATPKVSIGTLITSTAGKIKKNVEGTTESDAFFEFTIERGEGSDYPLPVSDDAGSVVPATADKLVIRRQGSGELPIGEITFKKEGEYFYWITETGAPENYSIDKTKYWLKYTVKKSEKGELAIDKITAKKDSAEGEVIYEGTTADTLAFTFTNTYTEKETETQTTSQKETTKPGETTTTPPTTTRSYTGGGPSGGGPSHRPGFSNTPQEGVPDSGSEVLGVDRALEESPQGRVLGANRKVLGANRLPRTGQLWWPVPVLLLFGAGMIGKGIYDRSKKES